MANFVGSTTEVNPDVDSSPFLPHQEECEEEHHDGTMFGTTINTLTAIIGGGILAIPLALANASIIPGVVLMLLCGSAAVLTSYFLICVCEHTQRFTYKDLMNAAFPNHVRWAGKLAEAVIFTTSFFSLIVYARVIGNSIPPVLDDFIGHKGWWPHFWLWIIIAGVFFTVLTCARKMSELRWSSRLGMFFHFVCVFPM